MGIFIEVLGAAVWAGDRGMWMWQGSCHDCDGEAKACAENPAWVKSGW